VSKTKEAPAKPLTFDEAVRLAREALDIAEIGRLRPMPLIHEGPRAYPASRSKP
jgi:hypothetical protein